MRRQARDMIAIESFNFTYPGMDAPALRDIRLRVGAGEAVLVRGASGSGKSTLLYCLNGLIPHVFAGTSTGLVRVGGFSPPAVPLPEIARTVGTVFQNPESQIFMMRVEDDVAFGCENLLLPREEIILRRDQALRAMGLWDLRRRETFTLSGGQKQRLAISSIYAMGPRLFLFDEPATDLDASGRREFLNIVRDLKAEGKTIVIVEHQYDDFLPLMDRVVTMDSGRISGNGRTGSVAPPPGKAGPVSDRTAVTLEGVGFAYNGGLDILADLDLEIKSGEVVALLGDNGSGKTTLLKIMGGILRPRRGKISILGLPGPKLESLVGRTGFLFQNPDEQLFGGTVEEEVAFGPARLGKAVDVGYFLDLAGLRTLRGRHPQTLSRGQRQILAVVSVLAMKPEVLLLDEPTTGLDDGSWHRLLSILCEYAHGGGCVIFSTHNEKAASAAGRRVTLQGGRIMGDEISG